MSADEIFYFWFGAPGSAERGTQRAAWFRKDPAFDASIASRFGTHLEAALRGELAAWNLRMPDALAEILVLDQFTRNVFRGTPRAFAGDARALAASRAIVARGDDRALPPVQRQFVYLPFEHAEDLAAQHEGVTLYEGMANEDPSMSGALLWARKHTEVIERFGRFPHRNAILGRMDTAEERDYLAQPGAGF